MKKNINHILSLLHKADNLSLQADQLRHEATSLLSAPNDIAIAPKLHNSATLSRTAQPQVKKVIRRREANKYIQDRLSPLDLDEYVELALMKFGPSSKSDLCAKLGEELEVSVEYLNTYYDNGDTVWKNDCAWAIERLRIKQVVKRPSKDDQPLSAIIGKHNLWELVTK